jgi:hypothetical protein
LPFSWLDWRTNFIYLRLVKDLKNATWIKLKGVLFLLIGIAASALLLARYPNWEVCVLLAISVWGFCRFYYFAFYVIEHYIDPGFKFSGLWSFARYFILNRHKAKSHEGGDG